jgi:HTH-type transcriptional regulator / antitoxin HigA
MIMNELKYKVIKTKKQYQEYCKKLEALVENLDSSKSVQEEIDLLTLLIEKYDDEHNSFNEVDPIQFLHSFMRDHELKAIDLAYLLNVSKGYVSDVLNYKKGLSKEVIRKLADHFKVKQEAFNRPYKLKSAYNSRLRDASVMNTKKLLTK